MKLPEGPDDGALPKERVLDTLREHCDRALESDGIVYIQRQDTVLAQSFASNVRRRQIQYLSRRLGSPIIEFYYPGTSMNS